MCIPMISLGCRDGFVQNIISNHYSSAFHGATEDLILESRFISSSGPCTSYCAAGHCTGMVCSFQSHHQIQGVASKSLYYQKEDITGQEATTNNGRYKLERGIYRIRNKLGLYKFSGIKYPDRFQVKTTAGKYSEKQYQYYQRNALCFPCTFVGLFKNSSANAVI